MLEYYPVLQIVVAGLCMVKMVFMMAQYRSGEELRQMQLDKMKKKEMIVAVLQDEIDPLPPPYGSNQVLSESKWTRQTVIEFICSIAMFGLALWNLLAGMVGLTK